MTFNNSVSCLINLKRELFQKSLREYSQKLDLSQRTLDNSNDNYELQSDSKAITTPWGSPWGPPAEQLFT